MASCQTAQWSNSSTPYVKLTVTQSSSTDTTATLTWTLQYIAPNSAANTSVNKSYEVIIGGSTVKSGTYDIDGKTGTHTIATGTKTITKTTSAQTISFSVSFKFNLTWSDVYGGTKSASSSISVAAKTSYTIKYNANGGSGAPSSQTKWYGTNITLSSTKPTRTGYTFQGWGTSTSDTSVDYAAGATYSSNASITLYAIWKAVTYTVTFNANGGSGAPSSQTKTYGVTLTLSSTKPTRSGYVFKGWGTSASSTTVAYAAGGSYTNNAAITLYAIWTVGYTKPKITNIYVARCDSSKNITDSGTYALVSFDWSTYNSATQYKITVNNNSVTYSISGTSGTVSNRIVGTGSLSLDSSYILTITVTDSGGSTSVSRTIPSQIFAIDIRGDGDGIAFGKAAETSGLLESAWDIQATSDDIGIWHKHTSTGQELGFGVGSSGVNRGVFDRTLGVWLMYWNAAHARIYIPQINTHYVPYYISGHSLNTYIETAGYVTNAMTEVHFVVPLAMPIIGNPAVTVSAGKFTLRQNNKYTHGSSASASCSASSIAAFLYTGNGSERNMIKIVATFTDTTNVTNNDAIGIYANLTIVLS